MSDDAPTAAGLAAFKSAMESREKERVMSLMAGDVIFYSPVLRAPFIGRDEAGTVVGHALAEFEWFRYTDELVGGDACALVFRARLAGQDVQGVDLVRFNDAGEIRELTVLARPLSGAGAFARVVAPKLASRWGRHRTASATALTRLLPGLFHVAEDVASWLVRRPDRIP